MGIGEKTHNALPRSAGDALCAVRRSITRHGIDAYRVASGDHNPIHFDDEFAATTRFGGVIAHGMLTLALISEMMAQTYGKEWLQSGNLRVRFRGAARPGDVLEAVGSVTKCELGANGSQISCSVEVRNADNGDKIITGSASVTLPPPAQGGISG